MTSVGVEYWTGIISQRQTNKNGFKVICGRCVGKKLISQANEGSSKTNGNAMPGSYTIYRDKCTSTLWTVYKNDWYDRILPFIELNQARL